MYVFRITSPFQFSCIPRDYNNGTVELFLRDELKNQTVNVPITGVFYQNGILILDFSEFSFKEGQSFEVVVNENQKLIYRGKAYATIQTDLQNFELNKGVLKV